MNNRKILLTTIILPIISFGAIAYADFDCSTLDKDAFKVVMDKQIAWETLTLDEQTLLDNAKTCMPERKEKTWSWEFMWRDKLEHNWEKTWSWNFMKWEKPDLKWEKTWSWDLIKWQNNYSLSTKYKNSLDKSVESFMNNISDFDDTKKLEKLENFASKIETLKTKISNSDSYNDTKKNKYNWILEYLLQQINKEISNISWDDDLDDEDILNTIFE